MILFLFDDFIFINIFFMVFWIFLFIFLSILEYKLKDYNFFSYAIGAFFAGLSGFIFATVPEQLFIFLFFIIVSNIIIYPIKRKARYQRIFDSQVAIYIGREAKVSKTIYPGQIGELTFEGISWEAIASSEDLLLEEGETVLISGKSELNLIASKFS